MDLQKGFPSVNERPVEDVIDALNTCCICGSKLHFKHETDFIARRVIERGSCAQCGIRIKDNEFQLQ